jgi:hypothetical protein
MRNRRTSIRGLNEARRRFLKAMSPIGAVYDVVKRGHRRAVTCAPSATDVGQNAKVIGRLQYGFASCRAPAAIRTGATVIPLNG